RRDGYGCETTMTILEDWPEGRRRKTVLAGATTSFLFFSIAILYFSKFPVLVSSFISNAFLILLLSAWTIALLVSSFAATRQSQVGLTLAGIWLYGFVIRAVTNLRLGMPFLHDSYFYMASTQNILGDATLTPT